MIELIPNDWDYADEEEDENDTSDDESPINVSFNKKILAVSGDRPKTAQPVKASDAPGDKLYRWKQMIDGGKDLPEYCTKYPVCYAGPARTPRSRRRGRRHGARWPAPAS